MSKRDEYIAKMKAKLDKWNSEISKLEAKATNAEGQLQKEYKEQIISLNKVRDEATAKLSELKSSSGSAWEDLKSGVDLAWESVSTAVESAAARYR